MRFKGLGALVLSVVVVGLFVPASALAAKPAATTGAAANVTFQSARGSTASVDPNREATNYYFQYGTTVAFGTETRAGRRRAPAPTRCGVSVDIGGLAPHHALLLPDRRPERVGHDARQAPHVHHPAPAARRLARRDAEPDQARQRHHAGGHADGHRQRGSQDRPAGQPVALHQGFQNVANEQLTNATGGFSFPLLSVPFNTQYRVRHARAARGRQPDRDGRA